jgi:hypothetical protein
MLDAPVVAGTTWKSSRRNVQVNLKLPWMKIQKPNMCTVTYFVIDIIFSSQYEEKSVHSRDNKATENDSGFDKAGRNK